MDINLWLPGVTSIVRISPTISPLNATLRSQEQRKWLPTKDCWTKSPRQHLRKRIENNMEGIHQLGLGWRGLNHFSHSILYIHYWLHSMSYMYWYYRTWPTSFFCAHLLIVFWKVACVYALFLMCFLHAFWVKYLWAVLYQSSSDKDLWYSSQAVPMCI